MTPRRPTRRPGRGRHARTVGLVCALALVAPGSLAHAAPRAGVVDVSKLVERLREAERVVVEAERAAAVQPEASDEQLAKRLVEGQLKLADRDVEPAAVIFLDLIENHPDSPAAPQAVYYLGEALVLLDMPRWAAELFSRNLSDRRPEARRYHQRSVARLFDLYLPRRDPGFARSPGMSATPEARARLASLGLAAEAKPLVGVVSESDAQRLERWAESFPPGDRVPQLDYSYGRYLYLTGQHERAVAELDRIAKTEGGGKGATSRAVARYRVRAAYVAAAAVLASGEADEALDRFRDIARVKTTDPRDGRIVELAWMAVARIHHDAGRWEKANHAYRRIGRDSPFFGEALYEIAWTFLRAGSFDRAEHALDLLLIHDPDSPLAPEIKQLRGKVKIQRQDYAGAEKEFLELRRGFDELAKKLGRRLAVQQDAARYFAAVIGEDMAEFRLDAVLPVRAVTLAQTLPRARQAVKIVQDVGMLEHELRATRGLLARMEEAVRARERARLFTDLGAHLAGVDTTAGELLEVRAALLRRVAAGRRVDRARLDATLKTLRLRVGVPEGSREGSRSAMVAKLQALARRAHQLELTLAGQRAQLIAAERYYEQTRRDQKIDHSAFLSQAAELRQIIGALEDDLAELNERIVQAETRLRYDDPLYEARTRAVAAYRQFLDQAFAKLGAEAPDELRTLWTRAQALEARTEKARLALDQAAGLRLKMAMRVLVEERANLDAYLTEWQQVEGRTRQLASEVLAASYGDVLGELHNLVMRSEVGLLDVAWAMKEVEQKQVERLEQERSRDLLELDRILQGGLEDLK